MHELCKKNAQIYCCESCDYNTSKKSSYANHLLTAKHKNNAYSAELCNKYAPKFHCKTCDYNTSRKSSYDNHVLSLRHKKANEIYKNYTNNNLCEDSSNNQISGELVMELLKQNNEFRELLKDQNKQLLEQNKYIIDNQNKHMLELMEKGIGNITNNNISNNTTKNKFNLNIFLNEQCKDAMNIMDFVNSLQLKLSDLERVRELGYVKGISHIVLNKLKALDICKRPIHCSDLKRETMYVKDENAWEKENGKNEKITKMIKHVAHKNQLQINEWRQENPDHKNPESVKCDKFLAIVNQSMGGSTEDDDINNYNKIIKNIAKEVIIDKDPE